MAPPAICLLLFSSDGLYLLLLASFLFLPQLNFCTLLLGAFVFFFILIITAIKIFASN